MIRRFGTLGKPIFSGVLRPLETKVGKTFSSHIHIPSLSIQSHRHFSVRQETETQVKQLFSSISPAKHRTFFYCRKVNLIQQFLPSSL